MTTAKLLETLGRYLWRARDWDAYLSEHSRIEGEPLGFGESDLWEVRMGGVQQHVPFSPNCGRGDQQGGSLPALDPPVAESPKGFVSRFAPTLRKGPWIEFPNGERIGNFALDRNQILGDEVGLQIHKRFDGGEGQRGGSVHDAGATAVPAPAI